MASFFVAVVLIVRFSQALLSAAPHETGFISHPTSSTVDTVHTAAPAPELLRRALARRDLTQTCGYFSNESFVCLSSSYCGYGSSNLGCYSCNSTASAFEDVVQHNRCFGAAEFSSSCAAMGACSLGTGWCNNPSAGATECVTLILTGQTNYTGFECGSTPGIRYGSGNGTNLIGGVSSFTTSMEQITSVTALEPNTVTVTTISTLTVSNRAELKAKVSSGMVVLTIILVAVFKEIALLLSV